MKSSWLHIATINLDRDRGLLLPSNNCRECLVTYHHFCGTQLFWYKHQTSASDFGASGVHKLVVHENPRVLLNFFQG